MTTITVPDWFLYMLAGLAALEIINVCFRIAITYMNYLIGRELKKQTALEIKSRIAQGFRQYKKPEKKVEPENQTRRDLN